MHPAGANADLTTISSEWALFPTLCHGFFSFVSDFQRSSHRQAGSERHHGSRAIRFLVFRHSYVRPCWEGQTMILSVFI